MSEANMELKILLLSDTTFGRGDGVAGLIDAEVEHDPATGLPFIRGRVLKGLLVEECANILFALQEQGCQNLSAFDEAAKFLFGEPGSDLQSQAHLQVGPGQLPDDLRNAVSAEIEAHNLTAAAALESLTAIRRQTAMNDATGAPDENSLRSVRVVLRDLEFTARLVVEGKMPEAARPLLAACASALRRGGMGRNRGRGELKVVLIEDGKDITRDQLQAFQTLAERKSK